MINMVKLPTSKSELFLRVAKGHFATSHSHINYYIDVTTQKSRLSEAKAVAKELVSAYQHSTIVDTVLCLDGTQVIGTCLANELTKDGCTNKKAHKTIYIVTPEYTSGSQIILRDNLAPMVKGKHVLILAASITTGYTIQAAVEAVNYYGGIVAGLSAIFATTHECLGYPVTSIFDPTSLPDYASFDSRDCPLCKAGQHIDALVNSFGYSALEIVPIWCCRTRSGSPFWWPPGGFVLYRIQTKLGERGIKSMKIPANGFTHAGKFHADDVFATALLQILRPDIKITRGFTVPDDFDGIVYDIGFGMFDHHQEPREYRANGVPYAAFGLLWRVLGPGLVGERQARLIDENFIQPLDLNANTGEQNSLCDAIGFFNPVWDSKEDQDSCFFKAVAVAKQILENQIDSANAVNRADEKVQQAYRNSRDGIVVLPCYLPWKNGLYKTDALFVVYTSLRCGWCAECVTDHKTK